MTNLTIGLESVDNEGTTAICWWISDDPTNEPLAGGYCATRADAINDASRWLLANAARV